jgi:methyl acetate hydrolase
MAKPDMSPKAVTVRIIRTGQLRRLCLQLKKHPGAQPTGTSAITGKKAGMTSSDVTDRKARRAENGAPDVIAIDSLLERAVAAGVAPGVVAVAANADGLLYEGAFGQSDVAAGLPMEIDALFRIASMTKAVTSVAVMQLVEQGRVELERPASEYVAELGEVQVMEGFGEDGMPMLRAPARPITVRQLLTHTAGFGYEIWSADLVRYLEATGLPSIFADGDDFLAAPLLFDPGERWEYGINTDWLGVLVERVSGNPLDTYLREHILDPLGMPDTHFTLPEREQPRLATAHARLADGTLVEQPREPLPPATFLHGGDGLVSAARDYLRFLRMLLGGGELDGVRVLEAATVDRMGRNQIGELAAGTAGSVNAAISNDFDFFPGSVDRFGLGFLINTEPVPGGRSAGSLTWAGLYNCYYWIDRESGVTGLLLTQILPFGDARVLELLADFERAVYSSR